MVDRTIVVELINKTVNVRKIHIVDICCLNSITENFIFVWLLVAILIMIGDLSKSVKRYFLVFCSSRLHNVCKFQCPKSKKFYF